MFPRFVPVEERIRASGTFPRIRDTEKAMKEYESAVIRKGKQAESRARRAELKAKEGRSEVPSTHLPPPDIEITNPNNYFSSFTLTDDPDLLKFLPYGELNYPKMFDAEPSLRNSIDNIWVAGFLDSASKPNVTGTGDESGAKVGSSSAVLPASSSLSAANLALKDEESSTFASSKPASISHSVTSGSQAESAAAAAAAAAAGGRLVRLSSFSTASSEGSVVSHSRSMASMSTAASTTASAKKRIAGQKKRELRTLQQKQQLAAMIRPYESVVKEVEEGKPKPKPQYVSTFVSPGLEQYFDKQREETMAAKKIQRSWRWGNMVHKIRFVVVAMRKAKIIQRIFKGYITRKWLARWYRGNTIAAIRIQCTVRKFLSNMHLVPVLVAQQQRIVSIQKAVRGKIGRLRYLRIKRNFFALKIQKMWRGLTSRLKSSQMWLDAVVVPLQTNIRRWIACRRVMKKRKELNKAALLIQRQFRSWSACKSLSDSLFGREMQYRMDTVTVLTAEEEYSEEKLAKLASRLTRHNYREKATLAATAMYDSFDDVRKLENLYLDQKLQREIVSPRAIVQGWVQSLDASIADLRKQVTSAKVDSIFAKVLEVETLENEVKHRMMEVDELVSWRNRVSRWKDKEYAERLEINYQREVEGAARKRRKDIGDEKRRWKILFYTKDGKPDRRRRPGRAWDPSVMAGPEKAVYSAGHDVQLLAQVEAQKLKEKGMKPGTSESVESTMAQYTLQTYMDQVQMYEKLLRPIQNIMESTLGGAPEDPNTAKKMGYGDLGDELPGALAGIGAVPQHWDPDRVPMGVNGPKEKHYDTVRDMLKDRKAMEGVRASSAAAAAASPSKGSGRRQRQARFEGSGDGVMEEGGDGVGAAVHSARDGANANYSMALVPISASASGASSPSPSASASAVSASSSVRELGPVRAANGRQLKRRAKRQPARSSNVIPWALLDELDGEKQRFANERSYFEFSHKFMTKP